MKTHHIIHNKILICAQECFSRSSSYFHHGNNVVLITSRDGPTINTIGDSPGKN